MGESKTVRLRFTIFLLNAIQLLFYFRASSVIFLFYLVLIPIKWGHPIQNAFFSLFAHQGIFTIPSHPFPNPGPWYLTHVSNVLIDRRISHSFLA